MISLKRKVGLGIGFLAYPCTLLLVVGKNWGNGNFKVTKEMDRNITWHFKQNNGKYVVRKESRAEESTAHLCTWKETHVDSCWSGPGVNDTNTHSNENPGS